MSRHTLFFCAILCIAGFAAACEPPKAETPAKNTTATNTPVSNLQQDLASDGAGPDNSRIRVKQLANGATVTIRSWKEGPIKKLKKRELGGEVKPIRITLRDGKEVVLDDKEVMAHALDWTAQQLADAAQKSGRPAGPGPAKAAKQGTAAPSGGKK